MSAPTIDEVFTFAQSLAGPGVAAICKGFDDLVLTFRENDALANQIQQRGLDAALSGEDDVLVSLRKSNKEFVTKAEQVAEEIMRAEVNRQFGTHAIVGEELGISEGLEWTWVFDPVDGTSAMIRSAAAVAFGLTLPKPKPSFGLTIGVLHGDKNVIGVVAELTVIDGHLHNKRTWAGAVDRSTTCNGVPVMQPTTNNNISNATLVCTVPDVMFATSAENWGRFQALRDATAALVIDQNCIGFMSLLDGAAHIALESDLTLPDVAALQPILQGAGLVVTNHKGEPLRFDESSRSREYEILAASDKLHAQAIALMDKGVAADVNEYRESVGQSHGYVKKF